MSRRRFQDMQCGVAQTLEIVGDWWSLLIIRECFLGTRRFGQFQQNLGIAKNILAARPEHPVEHDVLDRHPVDDQRQRHEYRLTARGKDLLTVITALRQWGDRWI